MYQNITSYLVSIHIYRIIDNNPRTDLDAVGRARKTCQGVWVLSCDTNHNRPRPAAVQLSDAHLVLEGGRVRVIVVLVSDYQLFQVGRYWITFHWSKFLKG